MSFTLYHHKTIFRRALTPFLILLVLSGVVENAWPRDPFKQSELEPRPHSMARDPMSNECRSSDYRLFTHQTFSLNATQHHLSLKIPSKDILAQHCAPIPLSSSSAQLISQIHFTGTVSLCDADETTSDVSAARHKVHVFTFDFSSISGDVYVDFDRVVSDERSLLAEASRLNPMMTTTLVISLVTRQFLTFRLLNLPTLKTAYLTRLVVLLSGESSIELIEKRLDSPADRRLAVEVFNSPIGSNAALQHKEAISFLSRVLSTTKYIYINLQTFFQLT